MNITPRSIFKGTNADGSKFTAQEWDFATASNIEVTGMLGILVVCLLFCSVASPILLILCIYHFTGRIIMPHIVGLIISSYFLYDCYSGWLDLTVLNLCFDETTIDFLVAINIVAVLGHVIFWIFGWEIFKVAEGSKNPRTVVLTLVAVIAIIGYMYGAKVTRRTGWVANKIKSDIESSAIEPPKSSEDVERDARLNKRWGN